MQMSLSKCMKKADIKYIRTLYNKRYKSKIQNYKIQGWGTKKSQIQRFEILPLCNPIPLNWTDFLIVF